MKKVVYICHPFRSDAAANGERLRRLWAAVKGHYVPLAPHWCCRPSDCFDVDWLLTRTGPDRYGKVPWACTPAQAGVPRLPHVWSRPGWGK